MKEKGKLSQHFLCAIGCLLFLGACARRLEQRQGDQAGLQREQPPQTALADDDGQWVRASKDFANTRFSNLNQIDRANVNQLKLAWTFSTGSVRGHEAPPLIVGNTMYVVTPFPNYLYALDLTKPGAPMK